MYSNFLHIKFNYNLNIGFKENFKSELEYQGIQLKELAAKCGISKNTLGNYLTGHNSVPSAENAVRIAKSLGVTVEYLVTGTVTGNHEISQTPVKYKKIFTEIMNLDDTDLSSVSALIEQMQKRYI